MGVNTSSVPDYLRYFIVSWYWPKFCFLILALIHIHTHAFVFIDIISCLYVLVQANRYLASIKKQIQ